MHVGVLMCMRARMRVYVGEHNAYVFAVPAPKCQVTASRRKSPDEKGGQKKKDEKIKRKRRRNNVRDNE